MKARPHRHRSLWKYKTVDNSIQYQYVIKKSNEDELLASQEVKNGEYNYFEILKNMSNWMQFEFSQWPRHL